MPHRQHHLTAPSSRTLGVVVLVIAAFALLYSAWTSYQLDQQVRCQSELNAQFLEVLDHNANVSEAERDSLTHTVTDLSEADSPSESKDILDAYAERRAELDAAREEYPPLPEDVCA